MKKTLYKIYTVLGVTALTFAVDSCLKDDRFVDFSKVGMVIEFPDAIPGKATAISFADPTAPGPDTVFVRINQTGPNATSSDITAQFGFSQAGLDTYNLDDSHVVGTALPSDAYSFPSSVTIKAGKDSGNNNNRSASIMLLIFPNKVPTTPGVNYVLSLGITSVSAGTASGNLGAILFNFYHNPWDGDYQADGMRYNYPSPAAYPGNYPPTGYTGTIPWSFVTKIVTVNATTSTVHVGQVDGGLGYMQLIVNPDNTVTIKQIPETLIDDLMVALPGSAGVTSTYDPATKTFNLYYGWTNTTTTGAFRVIHEKLVHL